LTTSCLFLVQVSKFVDVPYEPKGLSITPDGNLLVTCNPNKLLEYDVNTGEKKCEVLSLISNCDVLWTV